VSPTDSAHLLLRLYELRREPTLRRAREWFVDRFHPQTADDAFATWMAPDSAYYRMVTTYWDMAASLVNHGAIEVAMFNDANTEHFAVYAKLEPHLAALRERSGLADYLAHLERVVRAAPDVEHRLEVFRRYLRHRQKLATRSAQAEAR
jgi:hypothetical protein